MPAHRSRTDRWKVSLQNIYERGGGLEFSIDRGDQAQEYKDLVWRVRILKLTESEIVVEQPGAMGRSFQIEEGMPLIGIISVGQNKWTFKTRVLGSTLNQTRTGELPALRVEMPDRVKRCMRRENERTSLSQLDMPQVECWKLLDPMSAVPIEVANRMSIQDLRNQESVNTSIADDDQISLPSVGPKFIANLSNIGGGGVGLIVPQEHKVDIDSGNVFWIRLDLRPSIPFGLVMTTKLAHTHIDSQMNTYAGMAFDFSMNPQHKDFVVKEIARYIGSVQSATQSAA